MVTMKFPAMFTKEAPSHRDEAVGALSTFAHRAAYVCAGAAALCLMAAVLLAVSALNRFPAAVPEVLSWVSVGEGASFNGEVDHPVYGYLAKDPYRDVADDGSVSTESDDRYLLFDWDKSVPAAQEAADVLTTLMGAFLLLQGVRFFRDIEREGTPFTAAAARRLKSAGRIAVFAVVLSNGAGWLISSLAQTFYLTPAGMWKVGVWEIGAETGWMLALGMLLIAVGIAFDYGVVLQRQDDELL